MVTKGLFVVALIALATSGVARAEESDAADETGFYVAADLGMATAGSACVGLPAGTTCQDTDMGFRLGAGYQVVDRIAIEASYADYGVVKYANAGASASVASSGFQLAAVGELPLGKTWALTGRLGVAYTTQKSTGVNTGGITPGMTATSVTPLFGVGVKYKMSRSIVLRAQYDDLGRVGDPATLGQHKLNLLSAGVIAGF